MVECVTFDKKIRKRLANYLTAHALYVNVVIKRIRNGDTVTALFFVQMTINQKLILFGTFLENLCPYFQKYFINRMVNSTLIAEKEE